MRVFWSWQSDTPAITGRYFVKRCLEDAIKRINETSSDLNEVDEPSERDGPRVELDHDRKGVKGSPGLVDVIYEKIRSSDLVLCDVTPVAQISGPDERIKKLTNPNVAIELGFAQGTVGDRQILMVLNEHHGRHEDLAFDLRHKTGILTYNLSDPPPDAEPDRDAIKRETKRFSKLLETVIRGYLEEETTSESVPMDFTKTDAGLDAARWWRHGEILGTFGRSRIEIPGPAGPLIYLRMAPAQRTEPLARAKLRSVVSRFPTFQGHHQIQTNKHGAILISAVGGQDDDPIEFWGATQLFENGEVWAVDAYLPTAQKNRGLGEQTLPVGKVQTDLRMMIQSLAESMSSELETPFPVSVEFGFAPAEGYRLPMRNPLGWLDWTDPCYDEEVRCSAYLQSPDSEAVEETLNELLDQFWDRFGTERPDSGT